LQIVVSNPPAYSGPSAAGARGHSLNAYNATGAMLTDAIPGVSFSFAVMQNGRSDACPIDHSGKFKRRQQ
jgi:hypothetical protein